MNVKELRESLETMQDHWPVHIAMLADGSGGGADEDYFYTLECAHEGFPTHGNIAVIRVNHEPK